MRRFAFDAAGATNRSQKLEIFDVALSLGHTCARFSFDGLFDTEQNDMRKVAQYDFFYADIYSVISIGQLDKV